MGADSSGSVSDVAIMEGIPVKSVLHVLVYNWLKSNAVIGDFVNFIMTNGNAEIFNVRHISHGAIKLDRFYGGHSLIIFNSAHYMEGQYPISHVRIHNLDNYNPIRVEHFRPFKGPDDA